MGFRNLPEMKPTNKPQFAGTGFEFGGGETDHPVTSVNGETGAVVLGAADVGALPVNTTIPTKTSDLENDSGFVESDIIAPVETTSTASQAYTVGQYFINSLGQLCRVTVDIASGGTITVGTNCVVEPVGAVLTSLNSNSAGIEIFDIIKSFNPPINVTANTPVEIGTLSNVTGGKYTSYRNVRGIIFGYADAEGGSLQASKFYVGLDDVVKFIPDSTRNGLWSFGGCLLCK